MELVSVCIAAHNEEKTVGDAIGVRASPKDRVRCRGHRVRRWMHRQYGSPVAHVSTIQETVG